MQHTDVILGHHMIATWKCLLIVFWRLEDTAVVIA